MLLAEMTGCAQASMDVYDRSTGLIVSGVNPLLERQFVDSYLAHWRYYFSFWKRNAAVPAGQVLRSAEIFGEEFWNGAFYNEWSKPQGMGRDGRYVNLAVTDRRFAMLRACKPDGGPAFTPDEERLFEGASGHFTRSLSIHRRLRLAEAQKSALAADEAPTGFLIVDRTGRVLTIHEPTGRRLYEAGLISEAGGLGRMECDDPTLKRLICGAAGGPSEERPRAGEVEQRGRDGTLLRITVVPVAQSVWPEPWLAIDQPAALLYVAAPEDAVRERISRLAALHGLTPAEAAVAAEAAKGDGRAAVAARLGIRETTVRSHLSTIFDKLGIHRQAELTRLVSGL